MLNPSSSPFTSNCRNALARVGLTKSVVRQLRNSGSGPQADARAVPATSCAPRPTQSRQTNRELSVHAFNIAFPTLINWSQTAPLPVARQTIVRVDSALPRPASEGASVLGADLLVASRQESFCLRWW